MQAVVIREKGGPEVLSVIEAPDPTPGAADLLVKTAFAGVNFIDTYKRGGLYPMDTPFVLGEEGSGEVIAVGEDVDDFAVGDRVAWSGTMGAYAELTAVPAERAVGVPDDVAHDTAAAALLQGMTAHYLVRDTFPLGEGDRCLIHAGAGGVGRLLIQMAKRIGAEVFATAGTAEKAETARAAGADHVINYRKQDFREAVEDIAGPRPLHVVYDGVGATTFEGGLALLQPRGLMVAFGNASGPVPPVDPLHLMRSGSLYLTRPSLFHFIADPTELRRRAAAVYSSVASGELDVLIGARYTLDEAGDAHRALEARETVGKIVISTS